MKFSRTELVALSKQYFEAHPNEEVFYATPDGMFFTNASKGDANNHANHLKAALETIKRSEISALAETGGEPSEIKYPDGEPSEAWKVAELKAFMTEKNIAFEDKDTKTILLEKILEA